MSGLKKILSPFVEFKEEENKTTQTPIVQGNSGMETSTYVSGEIDPKYQTRFEKLFKELNLPGPDYYEYRESVKAMVSGGMPVIGAMKAALTVLGTQGVDKQKLIDSANTYLKALEDDKKEFNNTAVGEKNKEVIDLQSKLDTATQEIASLEVKISSLRSECQQMTADINDKKEKIQQAVQGFNGASDSLASEIQSDLEKIKNL